MKKKLMTKTNPDNLIDSSSLTSFLNMTGQQCCKGLIFAPDILFFNLPPHLSQGTKYWNHKKLNVWIHFKIHDLYLHKLILIYLDFKIVKNRHLILSIFHQWVSKRGWEGDADVTASASARSFDSWLISVSLFISNNRPVLTFWLITLPCPLPQPYLDFSKTKWKNRCEHKDENISYLLLSNKLVVDT